MLIYGYIHYKRRAGPAQACSAGARWKEPLVQTQIPHTQRREAARTPQTSRSVSGGKSGPAASYLQSQGYFSIARHKQLFLVFSLNG